MRARVRTLAFLLTAVPLGAVGVLVLIAGWTLTVLLAITPAVVPVLLGFRAVLGSLARAEASLANTLIGTSVRPPVTAAGGRNFWRRGYSVLWDPAFWRQQLYVLLRVLVGWTLAVLEVSLLATALGATAMPIYYRWSHPEIANGWPVDTLPRALLCVPAGVVLLFVGIWLLRPLRTLFRGLATRLLGDDRVAAMTPAEARARRLHALELHAGFFGLLNALLIVIWALTSRGYFWPVWTLLALGLPLAIHAWVVLVRERPQVARRQRVPRALGYYEGVALSVSLFLVLVWAVTGRGYFWPVWPILGFAIGLAAQAFVVVVRRVRRGEERIETLETSRAGAVDLQESELRRIERDLHDGAQARLVDVGMSLGLAEQKLRTDPGAAQELLAEARRGTHEALEELRDLARGIHPPMLTDRGLDAAVRSLVDRSPLDVHVDVELDGRPTPAVESAAYFVVAEAVANASKHAGANRLDIRIRPLDGADAIEVEVEDDGHGGADESGRGITGLRQRAQALDGTLAVSSPEGGPTVVRAVLPCAS
jgi:signal transduction histidine kinase